MLDRLGHPLSTPSHRQLTEEELGKISEGRELPAAPGSDFLSPV